MGTILISGAGSGIGRASAVALAAKGHTLVLLGRQRASLEETRALLLQDAEHLVVCADQRDKENLRQHFKATLTSLDALVANAGIGGNNAYGKDDRWDEVIATNLTGTYTLIHEALPYLRASNQAFRHIAIVSSILARLGIPGYTAYCASKAGLLGLTRALAAELAPERVLVNALCPGWVDTQMARTGINAYGKISGKTYEEAYTEQMSHVPLGKMSQPEEIAALIAFLCSPEQTSITGQTLDINNGAIMP